ncbi:hypothetical protein VNI00_013138 [Paramarasmius palmivorus]|uniref:Uncharacterized protein n=1 Tax=Paramarasmius palmivorus TaxID=297713 RepID=A0AAW0C1A1_9AGAR
MEEPVLSNAENDFEFNLEGKKSLVYFPVRGNPYLVDIERLALFEHDYSPYVPCQVWGGGRKKLLRRTCIGTGRLECFTLIFVDQGQKNRLPVNEFVTTALDELGHELGRPWIGPMLAEFDVPKEVDTERVFEIALDIVRYVALFNAFLRMPASMPHTPCIVWAYDPARKGTLPINVVGA